MNCSEIVDFMIEHCVSIQDEELEFDIFCSPRGISIRERGQKLPFEASKQFLMGLVFAKYDYFLNEVNEIKECL